MKILVTGGAGFIGSAVIRHLIKDTKHSVLNVDKLTYAGNLESLADAISSRYVECAAVIIVGGRSQLLWCRVAGRHWRRSGRSR